MHKALDDGFHFERAGLWLKNRAVLAPLTHNMSGEEGDPSQAELDWLARCACGGFGLLIAAATQVQPGGRCWPGQPALMTSTQQRAFAQLAESAKENEALALVQLHHGGVRALPELNDGTPVGPSAITPGGRYPLGVRALVDEEVIGLIDAFVRAAERACAAGLHGVELHAAHNFLLCNFLNPLLNRREDRWGGNLLNRARILVEIIRTIRARLPRSFLIGVRLSPESYAHILGIELAHQLEVARLLAAEEIDYLDFSMGDSFKGVDADPGAGSLLEAVHAGVALIAITALLGYTRVLSEQPLLLQGFKYVGAIYLLWMGITSWCGGHGQMSAQQADLKRGELMLRGFTVAISNPKSWLFMMTLLPPFLNPSMSVSLQIVLFVALITVIECVNLLLYAYGGQRANRMLQERGSAGLLGRLSAVMMVGIALFWLFG